MGSSVDGAGVGLPQVEQGFGMGITVRPVLGIAVMLVLTTRHNRAITMLFFRKLISFFILIILAFFMVYNVIIFNCSTVLHAKIGKYPFSSFGMFVFGKI
jgi:hypothetical protein